MMTIDLSQRHPTSTPSLAHFLQPRCSTEKSEHGNYALSLETPKNHLQETQSSYKARERFENARITG